MPTATPKAPVESVRCLLIEGDGRQYFTLEENLSQLIEFCKYFDMKMSLVEATGARVLDTSSLLKAICDGRNSTPAEFEVLKSILPADPSRATPPARTRSQILEIAKSVKEKIRERFSKGEAVTRDMLEEEFPDTKISQSSFMAYVRHARKEMQAEGYQFERISPGCYRAITPKQQKESEEGKFAAPNTWVKTQFTNNTKIYWTFMNIQEPPKPIPPQNALGQIDQQAAKTLLDALEQAANQQTPA